MRRGENEATVDRLARLARASQPEQSVPEQILDRRRARVLLPRPTQVRERVVPPPKLSLHGALLREEARVVGGEAEPARDRLEGLFGVVPHAVVVDPEGTVRLGHAGCQLHGPLRRLPRRLRLLRRGVVPGTPDGELGPGQGKTGIERHRLLVRRHRTWREQAPLLDLQSLEVGVVRREVRRGTCRQEPALLPGQRHLQRPAPPSSRSHPAPGTRPVGRLRTPPAIASSVRLRLQPPPARTSCGSGSPCRTSASAPWRAADSRLPAPSRSARAAWSCLCTGSRCALAMTARPDNPASLLRTSSVIPSAK